MTTDDMTAIDAAHAIMQAMPDDDVARLRFFERVADSELFVLLEGEPHGEQVTPRLFPVENDNYVLIFDREERLADFVGDAAPYAALSGRMLIAMLAGQGIGLGLNLDVAPSAMLIPAAAIDWLAATLANAPQEHRARLAEVAPPGALPDALIAGLDRKLATAAGLAEAALLCAVTYEGGAKGHLLAFVDAVAEAQAALAGAVGEALTFSGLEAGELDILFIGADDPLAERIGRVALRFELPPAPAPAATGPAAPGMDPENPPRLR